MLRLVFIPVILIFFMQSDLSAQAKINADSLVNVYEKYSKEDTVKLKILFEIILAYQKTNIDKALEYVEKAGKLAEKINIPFYKAESYFVYASVYISKGLFEEGESWLSKALPIYEKLKKRKEMADIYERYGAISMSKKESNDAKLNFEKAIQLYESCGEKNFVYTTSASLAAVYGLMGNYTKAIEIYNESIRYFEKNNMPGEAARALGNLSQSYFHTGETAKSIDCLFRSLSINEKTGNIRAQLFNCQNLAIIYSRTDNNQKAIEYAEKGLALNEIIKNKRIEAALNSVICQAYKNVNENKKAINCFQKLIPVYEEMDNQVVLAECYGSLSALLLDENQFSEAYKNYQNVLAVHEKSGTIRNLPSDLYSIGDLLLIMPDSALLNVSILPQNRYAESMKYLERALKLVVEQNEKEYHSKLLQAISKNYEARGKYSEAYEYYKKYVAIKDSISGDEVQKKITRSEIQYEYDKKELVLKYEQQLTSEQLSRQKLLTVQQKQALTLKEQALALSNKEKDLAHLAYLKEQAEKQEKTQQLSLSEEREKGKERDLILKNLELNAQQKQNFYLGLFSVLMLGGLGILLYFYQLMKKQKNIISQQNQLNEHTITILSHDIKEPLLGVKLMLKKLHLDDPYLSQASLSLENQINSVNGILNNLLRMKKLTLTKTGGESKSDVKDVMENVVKELSYSIHSKNITVDNQLPSHFTMPIGPEKLQIVVHNLLSNAIKYSYPDQTIKIYKEGNGFCIQDFGVGLSPEQRLQLMSEIKNSQKGTNQEKGFGMGLFLVGMMLQGEQVKIIFDSPDIGGTIVKILGG